MIYSFSTEQFKMNRIITSRITSIKEKPELFSGYDSINVLSWHKSDTPYYELSPYHLRTDGKEDAINPGGVIFENLWQSSKCYPWVYPIEVYCHPSKQGDPRYLWYKSTKNEAHIDAKGEVLPEYYLWRNEIFNCKNAIRYPNGKQHRHECKFLLLNKADGTSEKLDYLQSRKRV